MAVMILDDRISSGEAKAVALLLGCKVGVEDAGQVVRRDPRAVVADADLDILT
jgi:hypothetical protein